MRSRQRLRGQQQASLFENSDRFFTLIHHHWSGPNNDPFLFFHHIHPAFQPLTERRARHQQTLRHHLRYDYSTRHALLAITPIYASSITRVAGFVNRIADC